jgi:GNAT superfamily N-acetyltransferase
LPLTFQKVGPDEVDALYQIICECGEDMARRFGLTHWFPPYGIETMREHAIDRDVHAVFEDNKLVGTFTTGTHGWKYDDGLWMDRSCRALYLGKLAVLPSRQGRGVGTWCMQQVEQQARQRGCRAVRFDALATHTKLINYYHKLAYESRGNLTVTDWLGRDWVVTVFEKVLQAGKHPPLQQSPEPGV